MKFSSTSVPYEINVKLQVCSSFIPIIIGNKLLPNIWNCFHMNSQGFLNDVSHSILPHKIKLTIGYVIIHALELND